MSAKRRRSYYLNYTFLFLLLLFSCIGVYLLLYHKSSLRVWDTYDQQYHEFLYLGQWVRNAVRTLQFPVWDPSIGYGADFLTTMYSFIGNPINWIAVFVPAGPLSEYAFFLCFAINLYLCGAAYSFFALRRGHKPYTVLCGAVIYTFSACAYLGLYQPNFLAPMYFFPLLLHGTDELFEKGKSGWYTVVLTLSAVSNFYFVYMMILLAAVYCVLKWAFSSAIQKSFANLARLAGRFALYSLWAACMAAAALLPVAMVMLRMGRLGVERYMPLLYDTGFYQNMFKGFIATYDMQGRDCKIGYATLALVCVFCLFTAGFKKYRRQKTAFLLMAAGLCLPVVGRVMNGFGYVSNRWVWAFAFLVGYIVTIMLPEMRRLSIGRSIALTLCGAGYTAIAYAFCKAGGRSFLALSIALILICALTFCFRRLSGSQYRRLMTFLSCFTVILPSYFYYSTQNGNGLANWLDRGTAYARSTQGDGLPLLELIDTENGSRYNVYGLASNRNACWLYGVSGVNYYMSMYNDRIDQFHNSIALNTAAAPFSYCGLDRRSELLALTGVNHFFLPAGSGALPLDFDQPEARTAALGVEIQSWKPAEDHTLFTLFDHSLSTEQYGALTPMERQQALLQACVVDAPAADTLSSGLILESDPLPAETVPDKKGIKVEDDKIVITKTNAGLTLRFDPCSDAELYVFFDNIRYENGLATTYSISAAAQRDGKPIPNASNSYSGTTYISHMHGGKYNWLLNLGLLPEEANEVVVQFGKKGTYTLDGIHVYARSADSILNNIHSLNHAAKDISFGPNAMSVSVDAEKQSYLFCAVPYSEGWTAEDNGRSAEVLNADVGFMALLLEPGHHEITFRYHTPGLLAGSLISLCAVVGFILLKAAEKKRSAAAINA